MADQNPVLDFIPYTGTDPVGQFSLPPIQPTQLISPPPPIEPINLKPLSPTNFNKPNPQVPVTLDESIKKDSAGQSFSDYFTGPDRKTRNESFDNFRLAAADNVKNVVGIPIVSDIAGGLTDHFLRGVKGMADLLEVVPTALGLGIDKKVGAVDLLKQGGADIVPVVSDALSIFGGIGGVTKIATLPGILKEALRATTLKEGAAAVAKFGVQGLEGVSNVLFNAYTAGGLPIPQALGLAGNLLGKSAIASGIRSALMLGSVGFSPGIQGSFLRYMGDLIDNKSMDNQIPEINNELSTNISGKSELKGLNEDLDTLNNNRFQLGSEYLEQAKKTLKGYNIEITSDEDFQKVYNNVKNNNSAWKSISNSFKDIGDLSDNLFEGSLLNRVLNPSQDYRLRRATQNEQNATYAEQKVEQLVAPISDPVQKPADPIVGIKENLQLKSTSTSGIPTNFDKLTTDLDKGGWLDAIKSDPNANKNFREGALKDGKRISPAAIVNGIYDVVDYTNNKYNNIKNTIDENKLNLPEDLKSDLNSVIGNYGEFIKNFAAGYSLFGADYDKARKYAEDKFGGAEEFQKKMGLKDSLGNYVDAEDIIQRMKNDTLEVTFDVNGLYVLGSKGSDLVQQGTQYLKSLMGGDESGFRELGNMYSTNLASNLWTTAVDRVDEAAPYLSFLAIKRGGEKLIKIPSTNNVHIDKGIRAASAGLKEGIDDTVWNGTTFSNTIEAFNPESNKVSFLLSLGIGAWGGFVDKPVTTSYALGDMATESNINRTRQSMFGKDEPGDDIVFKNQVVTAFANDIKTLNTTVDGKQTMKSGIYQASVAKAINDGYKLTRLAISNNIDEQLNNNTFVPGGAITQVDFDNLVQAKVTNQAIKLEYDPAFVQNATSQGIAYVNAQLGKLNTLESMAKDNKYTPDDMLQVVMPAVKQNGALIVQGVDKVEYKKTQIENLWAKEVNGKKLDFEFAEDILLGIDNSEFIGPETKRLYNVIFQKGNTDLYFQGGDVPGIYQRDGRIKKSGRELLKKLMFVGQEFESETLSVADEKIVQNIKDLTSFTKNNKLPEEYNIDYKYGVGVKSLQDPGKTNFLIPGTHIFAVKDNVSGQPLNTSVSSLIQDYNHSLNYYQKHYNQDGKLKSKYKKMQRGGEFVWSPGGYTHPKFYADMLIRLGFNPDDYVYQFYDTQKEEYNLFKLTGDEGVDFYLNQLYNFGRLKIFTKTQENYTKLKKEFEDKYPDSPYSKDIPDTPAKWEAGTVLVAQELVYSQFDNIFINQPFYNDLKERRFFENLNDVTNNEEKTYYIFKDTVLTKNGGLVDVITNDGIDNNIKKIYVDNLPKKVERKPIYYDRMTTEQKKDINNKSYYLAKNGYFNAEFDKAGAIRRASQYIQIENMSNFVTTLLDQTINHFTGREVDYEALGGYINNQQDFIDKFTEILTILGPEKRFLEVTKDYRAATDIDDVILGQVGVTMMTYQKPYIDSAVDVTEKRKKDYTLSDTDGTTNLSIAEIKDLIKGMPLGERQRELIDLLKTNQEHNYILNELMSLDRNTEFDTIERLLAGTDVQKENGLDIPNIKQIETLIDKRVINGQQTIRPELKKELGIDLNDKALRERALKYKFLLGIPDRANGPTMSAVETPQISSYFNEVLERGNNKEGKNFKTIDKLNAHLPAIYKTTQEINDFWDSISDGIQKDMIDGKLILKEDKTNYNITFYGKYDNTEPIVVPDDYTNKYLGAEGKLPTGIQIITQEENKKREKESYGKIQVDVNKQDEYLRQEDRLRIAVHKIEAKEIDNSNKIAKLRKSRGTEMEAEIKEIKDSFVAEKASVLSDIRESFKDFETEGVDTSKDRYDRYINEKIPKKGEKIGRVVSPVIGNVLGEDVFPINDIGISEEGVFIENNVYNRSVLDKTQLNTEEQALYGRVVKSSKPTIQYITRQANNISEEIANQAANTVLNNPDIVPDDNLENFNKAQFDENILPFSLDGNLVLDRYNFFVNQQGGKEFSDVEKVVMHYITGSVDLNEEYKVIEKKVKNIIKMVKKGYQGVDFDTLINTDYLIIQTTIGTTNPNPALEAIKKMLEKMPADLKKQSISEIIKYAPELQEELLEDLEFGAIDEARKQVQKFQTEEAIYGEVIEITQNQPDTKETKDTYLNMIFNAFFRFSGSDIIEAIPKLKRNFEFVDAVFVKNKKRLRIVADYYMALKPEQKLEYINQFDEDFKKIASGEQTSQTTAGIHSQYVFDVFAELAANKSLDYANALNFVLQKGFNKDDTLLYTLGAFSNSDGRLLMEFFKKFAPPYYKRLKANFNVIFGNVGPNRLSGPMVQQLFEIYGGEHKVAKWKSAMPSILYNAINILDRVGILPTSKKGLAVAGVTAMFVAYFLSPATALGVAGIQALPVILNLIPRLRTRTIETSLLNRLKYDLGLGPDGLTPDYKGGDRLSTNARQIANSRPVRTAMTGAQNFILDFMIDQPLMNISIEAMLRDKLLIGDGAVRSLYVNGELDTATIAELRTAALDYYKNTYGLSRNNRDNSPTANYRFHLFNLNGRRGFGVVRQAFRVMTGGVFKARAVADIEKGIATQQYNYAYNAYEVNRAWQTFAYGALWAWRFYRVDEEDEEEDAVAMLEGFLRWFYNEGAQYTSIIANGYSSSPIYRSLRNLMTSELKEMPDDLERPENIEFVEKFNSFARELSRPFILTDAVLDSLMAYAKEGNTGAIGDVLLDHFVRKQTAFQRFIADDISNPYYDLYTPKGHPSYFGFLAMDNKIKKDYYNISTLYDASTLDTLQAEQESAFLDKNDKETKFGVLWNYMKGRLPVLRHFTDVEIPDYSQYKDMMEEAHQLPEFVKMRYEGTMPVDGSDEFKLVVFNRLSEYSKRAKEQFTLEGTRDIFNKDLESFEQGEMKKLMGQERYDQFLNLIKSQSSKEQYNEDYKKLMIDLSGFISTNPNGTGIRLLGLMSDTLMSWYAKANGYKGSFDENFYKNEDVSNKAKIYVAEQLGPYMHVADPYDGWSQIEAYYIKDKLPKFAELFDPMIDKKTKEVNLSYRVGFDSNTFERIFKSTVLADLELGKGNPDGGKIANIFAKFAVPEYSEDPEVMKKKQDIADRFKMNAMIYINSTLDAGGKSQMEKAMIMAPILINNFGGMERLINDPKLTAMIGTDKVQYIKDMMLSKYIDIQDMPGALADLSVQAGKADGYSNYSGFYSANPHKSYNDNKSSLDTFSKWVGKNLYKIKPNAKPYKPDFREYHTPSQLGAMRSKVFYNPIESADFTKGVLGGKQSSIKVGGGSRRKLTKSKISNKRVRKNA